MTTRISTGAVHHVTLTVSDVARSTAFYNSLLNFEVALELGHRMLLSNGSLIFALTPAGGAAQPAREDRFDETRIGLDHLSLRVEDRHELDKALTLFGEKGIEHGEIKDLGADLGLYVLAFRDPDNIQVELTAPYAS